VALYSSPRSIHLPFFAESPTSFLPVPPNVADGVVGALDEDFFIDGGRAGAAGGLDTPSEEAYDAFDVSEGYD